jgi:hypothetical protein
MNFRLQLQRLMKEILDEFSKLLPKFYPETFIQHPQDPLSCIWKEGQFNLTTESESPALEQRNDGLLNVLLHIGLSPDCLNKTFTEFASEG